MSTLTDFFIGYIEGGDTSSSPDYATACNGQTINASEFPTMYQELMKRKTNYPDRFDPSEEAWNQKLESQGYNYNFFIGNGKIIVPKFKKASIFITNKSTDTSIISKTVTYTVTYDDGTSETLTEPANTPVTINYDDGTSEVITLKDLETAFNNAEVA